MIVLRQRSKDLFALPSVKPCEVLLTGLERWSETRSLGIGRLAQLRLVLRKWLEATAGVSPQLEAYNAVIRTGELKDEVVMDVSRGVFLK